MYLGGDGDVVLRNLADQSQTKPNLDILEPSGVSYSPDGKLFAGSSFLGYARVWECPTWREKATLRRLPRGGQDGGLFAGRHGGWQPAATTRKP